MNQLQTILFRVVTAALALGLISVIPLKRGVRRVVNTACGALLLLVLLDPALKLKRIDPAEYQKRFQPGAGAGGGHPGGPVGALSIPLRGTAHRALDRGAAAGAVGVYLADPGHPAGAADMGGSGIIEPKAIVQKLEKYKYPALILLLGLVLILWPSKQKQEALPQ